MQLTDKKKKSIIAEYVECGNYRQVARKFKVSATTVKALVLKDEKTVQKCSQKKEQNTADILAHMETKKKDVCGLIDTYLAALTDTDKIKAATVNQLSTALGTVIDKFTLAVAKGNAENAKSGLKVSQSLITHIDAAMSDEEIEKALKGEKNE